MNKYKSALLAVILVCLFALSTFAEEPPPVCADGHTPINGVCRNGLAPQEAKPETKEITTFEEFERFIEWVESLF